jgi:hypothetical protein
MAITTLAAMPGTKRLAPPLALLATVAALSGCGSDEISGEIPAANATELNGALDQVGVAIASQDCDSAAEEVDAFIQAVNDLPADPSAELKPELQRAGDNLRTLVSDECPTTGATEPATTEPTTTEPTTTEPTTTEPTTTEPTTTTDETQTTTTTTDETTPDGNGGGPSGGGPPGQGGTGGTGGGTGGGSGD